MESTIRPPLRRVSAIRLPQILSISPFQRESQRTAAAIPFRHCSTGGPTPAPMGSALLREERLLRERMERPQLTPFHSVYINRASTNTTPPLNVKSAGA